MAIAVCEAGGLGSLPCSILDVETARAEMAAIRSQTTRPFNVNFFCQSSPADDPEGTARWKNHLTPYYKEFGLDAEQPVTAASRDPFNNSMCELVEEFKPEVVSFHFGLPESILHDRVKNTGAMVVSSATSGILSSQNVS